MNMMNVVTVLILTIVCGMIAFWLQALLFIVNKKPFLELQPRRVVPWTIWEVTGVALLFLILDVLAISLLKETHGLKPGLTIDEISASQMGAMMFASSTARMIVCVLALATLVLRYGANLTDLGLTALRSIRVLLTDFRIGVIGFLMLAGPMFIMQMLLTKWFPSEHPVETLIKKSSEPGVFLITLFAAVIVAPIAEEMFFRLILQGWLEKLVWKLTHNDFGATNSVAESNDAKKPSFPAPDPSNPYATPATESASPNVPPSTDGIEPTLPEAVAENKFVNALPIITSATIFAAMHYGHGPDPIPLFFLAVGLGYIYRRTHRILPCIIIHFLVNATSMTMLAAQILEKQ